MSAIARLRGWLDGRQDYQEGLALLEEYGSNQALLKVLRMGASGYYARKLGEELARLSRELPAEAASELVRPVAAPQVVQEKPADVHALEQERVLGFKEASRLQSQLRRMATNEERRLAAVRIKQLFRRNEEIWSQLQYYAQHGQLPPTLPEQPAIDLQDRAAITLRRNTLRTYMSSKRGTPEKRMLWQAELMDLDRRLAE